MASAGQASQAQGVPSERHSIYSGLIFVRDLFYPWRRMEWIMDAAKEREIIRLWNQLRLLEREGRPTAPVRRQIEAALAERERDAA